MGGLEPQAWLSYSRPVGSLCHHDVASQPRGAVVRKKQGSQRDMQSTLSSLGEEAHEALEGLQDPIQLLSPDSASLLNHLKEEGPSVWS